MLYEIIVEILNTEFQLKLTGSQVNNKFQTLIRTYKAVVDNNKKTARERKYFKFEEQMDTIFHKSKRINPEILLTESEVIRNTRRACNDTPTLQRSVHEVIDKPDGFINKAFGSVEDERKTAVKKTTINLKRKGTRTDVLEGIWVVFTVPLIILIALLSSESIRVTCALLIHTGLHIQLCYKQ
jgi:hypothetical protein